MCVDVLPTQVACSAIETVGMAKCPDCLQDAHNLPCILAAAGGASSTCGTCLAPYIHGQFMMKDAILSCMDMTAMSKAAAAHGVAKITCTTGERRPALSTVYPLVCTAVLLAR